MTDWRSNRRFAAIDWRYPETIIDSRDWGTRDGWTITATVVYDEDTRITDNDAYKNDPEIVKAWRLDLWTFVEVLVTASREGVVLGTARMGGVEYGVFPLPGEESKFLDPLDEPGYWDELVGEAVAAAEAKLAELTASRGPIITFDDPDGLISVLTYANLGLATRGWTRDGDGLTYDFHLADGRIINGTFYREDRSGDAQVIVIATHDFGSPTGDKVEVAVADIVRVVYC